MFTCICRKAFVEGENWSVFNCNFSGQDFKYSYDGEQFYTDPAAASPTAGSLSPSGFGTVYFNNPYTTDETTLKEFVRKQM